MHLCHYSQYIDAEGMSFFCTGNFNLLERYIYNRLVKFLMSTGFFTPSKFGFCKDQSTEHTILVISQFIHDALDNEETEGSIFVDIKKGFDAKSHFILKIKLDRYGIRGPINTLIPS